MIRAFLKGTPLVLALVAASLVAPASSFALSDEVQVQAPGNSGTFENVSLSSLGNPTTQTYSIGGSSQQLSGYSLTRILNQAASISTKLSLAKVTGVQVDRPTKGLVAIEKAAFSSGPPIFFEEDGAMKFVDPTGPRILTFEKAIPAVKLMSVVESVSIVALPTDAKAGETVRFAPSVDGTAAGEDITENWTFGDGTGSSASGTHVFKAKGTYTVRVVVTGDQGFRGAASYTYTVGAKKTKKKKKKKEDPPANSNQESPDLGGYDPYGDYGDYGDYGTGTGSGYPGGTGTSPGPSAPSSPNNVPDPDPVEPPVDDGLIEISGELVSSATPAATMSPGEAMTAEVVPDVVTEESGFGLPKETWTVLGVLLLLGLGMAVERRSSRI